MKKDWNPIIVALIVTLIIFGICAACDAFAATIPPVKYIPQSVVLQGCFHNTNGNCPAPLAGTNASAAQIQSDWNLIATFERQIRTDKRAVNYAHSAGAKVSLYADFVRLHENSCCLSSSSFDPGIVMKKAGSQSPVFVPNANPAQGGSFLGDPTTTGTHSLLVFANSLISGMLADQYGSYAYDLVENDDVAYPGQSTGWESYCDGIFPVSSPVAGCPSANPALTVKQARFLRPSPVDSLWISGMHGLFQGEILPVLWNGDYEPGQTIYNAPINVYGGMCENCLTGQAEIAWENQLNAGVVTMLQQGLVWQLFNPYVHSVADDLFVYASAGLIADAPALLQIGEETDGYAAVTAPSGLPISPLAQIVPSGPRVLLTPLVPTAYNDAAPPTTAGVGALKQLAGAYVREYTDCYVAGIDRGPCAYVANPTGAAVRWPGLVGSYARTATYTGFGLVTAFGDTGTLSIAGPPPPAMIAPGQGVIAFS